MKIFLILFIIHNSSASEPLPDAEVWRVGKLYYSFKKDKMLNALMSESCTQKKNSCEAYAAVKNKQNIQIADSDRRGGKNPGAVACKKKYNGEVLILRNSADNESAFCKFKDNSIASVSDLY